MGLFDMFGAGGGTLTVQLGSVQVAPGQTLQGAVSFGGGKRAQNITSIKARVVIDTTTMGKGPDGKPHPQKQTKDVCPEVTLSGAFQTNPASPIQLPFQFVIPQGVPSSMKGQVDYRVVASADIPGEVDPGASAELQVVGGAQMGAGMGMGMGMPMQQQMPMQQAMGPQIGQDVVAQWQDGSWQPARVVAMQNGMIGVDWHDPKLGQSTWLQPQQVQAGKGAAPMQPMMPPMGAAAMGKPLGIGSPVLAQYQDGSWQPGRVVAMQNGMVGVDWDNPKLGASAWVQPNQIKG